MQVAGPKGGASAPAGLDGAARRAWINQRVADLMADGDDDEGAGVRRGGTGAAKV